jgi:single-strand DNA-binding protein
MAEGLNKWTGIGYLGQDAEIRCSKSGLTIANFAMACGEKVPDKDGNWIERTEWVKCVVFGKKAEALGPLLKKGTRVYVEGPLQTRSYINSSGQEKTVVEARVSHVVFVSSNDHNYQKKTSNKKPDRPPKITKKVNKKPINQEESKEASYFEDEVPF